MKNLEREFVEKNPLPGGAEDIKNISSSPILKMHLSQNFVCLGKEGWLWW